MHAKILFFTLLFVLLEVTTSRHHGKNHKGHHANKHGLRRHGRGQCMRCPVGWGVKIRCDFKKSPQSDTVCAPCQPGTYSAHHSLKRGCYPCSRCGFGLYVAHTCTASRDTVCDSCMTVKGPRNEDFVRRCINHTYPVPSSFSNSIVRTDHIIGDAKNSALTSSIEEHVALSSQELPKQEMEEIISHQSNALVVILASSLTILTLFSVLFASFCYWRRRKMPRKPCFKCKIPHKYQEVQSQEDALEEETESENVTSC